MSDAGFVDRWSRAAAASRPPWPRPRRRSVSLRHWPSIQAAGERQLIGAAVILAQHFHRLVRRRFSNAVELRQPLFTRCHLVNLRCRASKPARLSSAAKSIVCNGCKHSARMRYQCGISGAGGRLSQFAVMGRAAETKALNKNCEIKFERGFDDRPDHSHRCRRFRCC